MSAACFTSTLSLKDLARIAVRKIHRERKITSFGISSIDAVYRLLGVDDRCLRALADDGFLRRVGADQGEERYAILARGPACLM